MKANFDTYSTAYEHVRLQRENGILEVTLSTAGGALIWGDGPHTELGFCFADIAADPENRVVILTGTGGRFIGGLDDSWVGAMTPEKWDKIYHHGRRLIHNLLDIEAPVIAAVNGPARIHAELALLSNIVIASDDADFQDAPHFKHGAVPGDGTHIIWPELLGQTRGQYFLLTGQRLTAKESLELGLVNEVVPKDAVLERARELAAVLARQPDTTLRYTRAVLTQRWKKLLLAGLGHGLALEGLGAFASWPTGE